MLAEVGAAPKIRPINEGTTFAKVILSVALKTREAQAAAERVKPYQLSPNEEPRGWPTHPGLRILVGG